MAAAGVDVDEGGVDGVVGGGLAGRGVEVADELAGGGSYPGGGLVGGAGVAAPEATRSSSRNSIQRWSRASLRLDGGHDAAPSYCTGSSVMSLNFP